MDVRIILKPFPDGIVRYVEELGTKIVFIANSVLVITGVPDVTGFSVLCRERIAALDELNAFGSADVDRWCDVDVDVVGHDGESVKEKFAGVAVAEEGRDEKLGALSALEVMVAFEGEDGYGIRS